MSFFLINILDFLVPEVDASEVEENRRILFRDNIVYVNYFHGVTQFDTGHGDDL